MKTAFFDLNGWEIPHINEQCKNTGIDIITTSIEVFDATHINQINDAEILSVFLSKVDQSHIDALPKLKLISTRATGFDHIDIEYAKKRGIAVINIPSYCEQSVAEYAMGLMLMLSRKLNLTYVNSLFGNFDQKTIQGHDLENKTLGVIGTGKIGRKLIKMASGFDMKIICYDAKPKPELIAVYNTKYVSLETLLKESDVISIHLPYTPETHHLINFETLKLLKIGVLLVNTARGPIVDTSALRQGLKDNIFGGVALDTFEAEQIWINKKDILDKTEVPSDKTFKKALEAFDLLEFKNVILSPHNAFNTYEAVKRMLEITLTDIITFQQKNNCSHRVV
ncbi:MAG: NAD(P)-dependent oxidoreductase [bacterium]